MNAIAHVATPQRLVADATSAALPAIIMDARRAAASIVMGEHGKRRAGAGDAFWQHREWSNGESTRQIDWRRSARSDRLFVRERERQVPALLQVWCDTRPSMNWRSGPDRPTKVERGLVIGLAIAIATRAGGERVCALTDAAPFRDELSFSNLLIASGQFFPSEAKAGQVLIVSDGLEPPEIWASRIANIRAARADVIVVLTSDTAERDFPFMGRNLFQAPAGQDAIIIGRAQSAQSDYQIAYKSHVGAVEHAIKSHGGQVFSHITSVPSQTILLQIVRAMDHAVSPRQVA
jgi:uncharacterized protein (DUF58 family)